MLVLSEVDRGFDPQSDSVKDIKEDMFTVVTNTVKKTKQKMSYHPHYNFHDSFIGWPKLIKMLTLTFHEIDVTSGFLAVIFWFLIFGV